MTTPSSPQEPFTPFLPTTYDIPEESDRLRSFFSDNLANFADVVNDKKIGLYMQAAETLNGNKFYYKTTSKTRNGYQAILWIENLPNNTTQTYDFPVPDVNDQFVITNMWGTASLPPTTPGTGDYFTYLNEGNSKITFTASDIKITITTTTNLSGYQGLIIVEYIRDGF